MVANLLRPVPVNCICTVGLFPSKPRFALRTSEPATPTTSWSRTQRPPSPQRGMLSRSAPVPSPSVRITNPFGTTWTSNSLAFALYSAATACVSGDASSVLTRSADDGDGPAM